ncbi:ATP-grasp domain-containing protein [Nigerium massiliense]|uniref:hypothetical protein n=1 Tax=Nigerium massiliense TaxID=1522317 RepID=UPI000591073C|nr:hypothetical protein [Nigerium massiliense]
MTAVVGLVTADPEALGDAHDDDLDTLVAAFNDAGIPTDAPIWNDPNDWAGYQLLVLRSPWDYSQRPEDFLDWVDEVEQATTIRNHPTMVRWNYDKHYMDELAARGVPCVRSTFCGTGAEVARSLASHGKHKVVVKPSISAGTTDTGLFVADDPHALALGELILGEGKTVVVQPALGSVNQQGERSLVYLGGRLSHAITRGAILGLGGGYIEGRFSMPASPAEATPDEVAVGDLVIETVRAAMRARRLAEDEATPVYGRIDLIRADDGRPLLVDADLFEPNVYLTQDAGAVDRYVAAVRAILDRVTV